MATRDYYARREWCLSSNCDVPALIRSSGSTLIAADRGHDKIGATAYAKLDET